MEHVTKSQAAKAEAERLRSCSVEEINSRIATLLPGEGALLALLENPQLQQSHLLLLLERRQLGAAIIERIAARKEWVRDTNIRRGLVAHSHTPPWLAMKLARDLEVTDLLTISFRPSVPAEIRRYTEELIVAHIPQLALGQRLSLARKGPGRVVAELLAGGDARVARVALDSAYLTEAQLLRVLASERLSAEALAVVAGHGKWSNLATVRTAALCHSKIPAEQIAMLLPRCSQGELEQILRLSELRSELRDAIRQQCEERSRKQSRLDTPTTGT